MVKAITITYFWITILIIAPSSILATPINSLNVIAGIQNNGESEAHLYVGKEYYEKGLYEKALEAFLLAYQIESKSKNSENYVQTVISLGQTQFKLNDYETSNQHYKELLDYWGKKGEPAIKSKIMVDMGINHRILGNSEQSYTLLLDALQLQGSIGDNEGKLKSLYQLGTLFFYQKNYPEALNYYQKTHDLAKEINIQRSIYSSLAAIGSVYDRQENLEMASKFGLEAYEMAKQMDYAQGMAYSAHNLGSNFLSQKQYFKALEFFEEALAIKRKQGDKWGQVGTIRAMSALYNKIGESEKAITTIQSALEIAQEIGAKNRILEAYYYMAEAYKSAGKAEDGYKFLNKYIQLNDSVMNQQTISQMKEIKTDYEIQQKEAQIELLQKENEIDTLNTSIAISTALFLLILSLLLGRQIYSQKKSNRLLEEKNREISNANEKIDHQNKALESSNEELQQFAYVASHDLKEPLRMIGSYTSLIKRRYVTNLDPTAHEFMDFVVDGVTRMENLLNDLLTYSRVNSRELVLKNIDTKITMAIVLNNLQEAIKRQDATVNINYDKMPEIKASKTQINQLFQNLISNAIKFRGPHSPVINIDCQKNNDQYIFSIKDNGIGINPENQQKIFEMFRRLHTNEEFEGTGIGLATCKKIVEKHKGKIWVESTVGEGSSFFFSIPIQKDASQELKNGILIESISN